VRPDRLADSFATYLAVIEILEHNRKYQNLNPKCEPQLGRRGLYGTFGGKKTTKTEEMAMLWTLNLSDGNYTLLDIAERADLPFAVIKNAANSLIEGGLLAVC
jgi:aminopeptidase-like protein